MTPRIVDPLGDAPGPIHQFRCAADNACGSTWDQPVTMIGQVGIARDLNDPDPSIYRYETRRVSTGVSCAACGSKYVVWTSWRNDIAWHRDCGR